MPKAAAGAKAKADVKAPGTLPVKAVATAAVTPTAPPTRFLERLAAYPVVRQLPASLTSLALESELVKTVVC